MSTFKSELKKEIYIKEEPVVAEEETEQSTWECDKRKVEITALSNQLNEIHNEEWSFKPFEEVTIKMENNNWDAEEEYEPMTPVKEEWDSSPVYKNELDSVNNSVAAFPFTPAIAKFNSCSIGTTSFFKQPKDCNEHQTSKNSSKRIISCIRCEKTFSLKSYLTGEQITLDQKFLCIVCRNSPSPNIHKGIPPTEKRSFSCSGCGKSFSLNSFLSMQQTTTFGVQRSFLCITCNKPSTKKKSCNSKHNEEKPMLCNICGKSFNIKHKLKLHKISHQRKRLSCRTCEQTFTTRDNLKLHQLVHYQDKRFSCLKCGKKFKTNSSLKTHQITHLGEQFGHFSYTY